MPAAIPGPRSRRLTALGKRALLRAQTAGGSPPPPDRRRELDATITPWGKREPEPVIDHGEREHVIFGLDADRHTESPSPVSAGAQIGQTFNDPEFHDSTPLQSFISIADNPRAVEGTAAFVFVKRNLGEMVELGDRSLARISG